MISSVASSRDRARGIVARCSMVAARSPSSRRTWSKPRCPIRSSRSQRKRSLPRTRACTSARACTGTGTCADARTCAGARARILRAGYTPVCHFTYTLQNRTYGRNWDSKNDYKCHNDESDGSKCAFHARGTSTSLAQHRAYAAHDDAISRLRLVRLAAGRRVRNVLCNRRQVVRGF